MLTRLSDPPKLLGRMSFTVLAGILTAAFLIACEDPAERAAEYMARGKTLFEQEDFSNARLAFKNALRLDRKNTEAIYHLGLIAEHDKNWAKAFKRFAQVVIELLTPPAVSECNSNRTLGVVLTDDVAVELGNDFARCEALGKTVHVDNFSKIMFSLV